MWQFIGAIKCRMSVPVPEQSIAVSADCIESLRIKGLPVDQDILYPALASRSDVHFHGLEECRF